MHTKQPSITSILPRIAGFRALFVMLALAAAVRGQAIEGYSLPYRVAELAAPTAGIMQVRHAKEGQHVQNGQTLFSLDASVTKAALAIARANLEATGDHAAAEADYRLRKDRLTTLRKLTTRGHATDDELRRTQTEYELAAANLQAANERKHIRELECAKLEAELAAYSVTAPFDGVVTQFHKSLGEYIGPGDFTVCTLAELTTLSVEFLVSRSVSKRFPTGTKATTYFTESNVHAGGEVCFVSPIPAGETGMFILRIRVDNPRLSLSAGERCVLVDEQKPLELQQASHGTKSANSSERPGT